MKHKKQWYVLITKPKAEQKVATRLEDLGLEVYCPVKTEVRQWSDRKKKVKVPLLPSMVLVCLAANERNLVFSVVGVLRYLFWLGEPAIVPAKDIKILRETLTSNYQSIRVEKMQIGDTIAVEGFGTPKKEGKIKYISGNQCWVVLQHLGFVVKMQI